MGRPAASSRDNANLFGVMGEGFLAFRRKVGKFRLWGGVDLASIAPNCESVLHCLYTTRPDRIGPALTAARQRVGAGFQLLHPEVSNRDDLQSRMQAALGLVDGVNYFNPGVVPDARLGWISHALDG